MHNIYKYSFIFFLSIMVFGCNESTEMDHHTARKDTSSVSVPEIAIDSYSKGFQKLLKSPSGTFRGVNLGDPMALQSFNQVFWNSIYRHNVRQVDLSLSRT